MGRRQSWTTSKLYDEKIGVVTLALACVFAAGWVRSLYFSNGLWAITGDADDWSSIGLISFDQQLGVLHQKTIHQPIPSRRLGWDEFPTIGAKSLFESMLVWEFRWWGFGIADNKNSDTPVKAFVLPYSAIVIPLTLLSAWLLLSKSRTISKKITEPIDEGVT